MLDIYLVNPKGFAHPLRWGDLEQWSVTSFTACESGTLTQKMTARKISDVLARSCCTDDNEHVDFLV